MTSPQVTSPQMTSPQMTSPQMTREHLSSQRSSSRASSRKLPTTRVDKPSPIPEVGLSKSADFDKITSNENYVDGKKHWWHWQLQEEESVVARNTDGSIQLKLDQVRLKTFASKLKMVIKKSGRFKRTRKARATTCQSFWTDRHQKGWFDIIINCSSCVNNITSIAEPQNHFKCMVSM